MGVDVTSTHFAYGRVVGNVSASIMTAALTGGGCLYARVAARSLLALDAGHASYAAASGDYTAAAATITGQLIGLPAGRSATGHIICFVEGTPVATQGADGEITGKNIEQIEPGDLVWARNEFTGEEGFKPVVHLFRNETDTLVHLTYTTAANARSVETGARPARKSLGEGGSASARWTYVSTGSAQSSTHTITGTTEHPFWSLTRGGWIAMGELKPGERLLLAEGQTATATSVRTEHLATPVTVYNFEVADWHTYHVGSEEAGWVFVHNLCARGAVNKLKALRLEARTKGTELNKLVSAQRRTAVEQAWAAERAMVMRQGYGTRKWTGAQMQELLTTGRVRRYQGHHINSVKSHPYMAGMPSNLRFMTRWQHFKEHLFNWRNPTSGPLLDRGVP